MNYNIEPENWTTEELFGYCQINHIIDSDDEFSLWKEDRIDLLKMVKYDLQLN